MTNEKKTYVLYEYLVFFYKKKWLIVLLPLIGLVVGALLSFMMAADKEYEGDVQVYVGNAGVDSPKFADPDLIRENREYIEEGSDVKVPPVSKPGFISFELTGEDPQVIEDTLQLVSDNFFADLMNFYEERRSLTERSITSITEQIQTIEETVALYENELKEGDISPTLEDTYKELLYMNRNDLLNHELRVERMQTDLLFFENEKPEQLNVSVQEEPDYLKSNMLVGVVLGLLFSIISLMLWKYIFEARRDGIND